MQYDPDNYSSTVQTSAPRQIDCFTIALGKKTGTTFPITFNNNQNYNALYDTGTGASLINYSAYVSLGQDLDTRYQPLLRMPQEKTWALLVKSPALLQLIINHLHNLL